MNKKIYNRILVELGEVLQSQSMQKKLGFEYKVPAELTIENGFFGEYYVFRLRRTIANSRRGDDGYIRPYYLQEDLQHNLDMRRLTGISFTGRKQLTITVTEDSSRFYKIFVKVGG